MFKNCCVRNAGHELSVKLWTRQTKSAAFSLFLLILVHGAIFALNICLIILLGCAFPGPMQTSGTIYTIWNALDFTTSVTVRLPTLRGTSADSSFHGWSVTSKKHAESKRWRNLCVYSLDFYLSTLWQVTLPHLFQPDNRSRMSLSLYLQCLHVSLPSLQHVI